MKQLLAIWLLTLLAGPAAANDERSLEQVVRGQEAVTRYYLAAAEAEGDVLSDAYLLKLLALTSGDPEIKALLDPALMVRVDLVRAQLAARVQAARNTDAVLLSSELRCQPSVRLQAACGEDLARLAELAGDNGYHHFVLMGHAWAREDAEGFLRHARLAAQAPDFRHDIEVVFRSVHQRLRQAPDDLMPRPEGEDDTVPAAGLVAMGIAAAFALPAYQNYVQPCRESEGELRAHCLAIADRLLEESAIGIDIFIAHAIYEALGETERQSAAQVLRDRLRWQQQAMAPMEERFDRRQWQAYFDAYAEGGEKAAFAYAAEALGVPLDPPPGWSPESPM